MRRRMRKKRREDEDFCESGLEKSNMIYVKESD